MLVTSFGRRDKIWEAGPLKVIVHFGPSIFPPHQPDLLHVKKELPRQRMFWKEIGLEFNWWSGRYATAIKLPWKANPLFYTEATWLCLDNAMCVNSLSFPLDPLWVEASLGCQWARCKPVRMIAFMHILAGMVLNSPVPPNLTVPLTLFDHPPCGLGDAPFNLIIPPPALKPLHGSLSSMLAITKFTSLGATERWATKNKSGYTSSSWIITMLTFMVKALISPTAKKKCTLLGWNHISLIICTWIPFLLFCSSTAHLFMSCKIGFHRIPVWETVTCIRKYKIFGLTFKALHGKVLDAMASFMSFALWPFQTLLTFSKSHVL